MAEYRSSGKELRKSPKGLIAGTLLFAMVVAAACGLRYVQQGMQPVEIDSGENSAEVIIPGMTETTEDPDRILYENREVYLTDMCRGDLVYVSRDYLIDDVEYGLVNVYEEKSDLLSVADMNVRLQQKALEALGAMAADLEAETGLRDLLIEMGFRSRAEQLALYEADLQRTGHSYSDLYAVPGGSELETGLAVELKLFQGGRYLDFTAEDDHAWVLEHCAEYGLIQRYPADKEDITKVRNETNMFRYIGVPHALYLTKNDLTLDEYVQLLENYPFDGPHLVISDKAGKEYEVYYVPADLESGAETTSVPVPSSLHYAISGSNRGGFYVTVELEEESRRTSAVTRPAERSSAAETTQAAE